MQHRSSSTVRSGPGVSMVDLEESAGHAAPPQGGFEPISDIRADRSMKGPFKGEAS
ncbi:hypothetical protein [Roseinatronobacter monicus]|uniref:Uncharacterized protein n=1 Tax=Roseinatronobacter monicus TaxID=393481 RepID=A0A543KGA3_9RHOB|nr:hypothetical protein [Roseinatronobacter monicus]TQM94092.1 hypothetical protein BD293_2749 [Roseinatronobacter monicus]